MHNNQALYEEIAFQEAATQSIRIRLTYMEEDLKLDFGKKVMSDIETILSKLDISQAECQLSIQNTHCMKIQIL